MALIVVAVLVLVYFFVGSQSFQTFTESHLTFASFFLNPRNDSATQFGILVYIIGSLSLIALVLLISVPFSIAVAVFLSEVCPYRLRAPLRAIVELFLGIPSIIFGLIGLLVVIPAVAGVLNALAGGIFYPGDGIIPAVIVVTFMVLPTITTIAYDALQAVPQDLREGSLALGATRWQTIRRVLLPASLPGLTTAAILGIARALGETVAVAFVIGNGLNYPISLLPVYPHIGIGPTSVLTVLLLFNFAEALPHTTVNNTLWTVSFILLAMSAILVGISRMASRRRIYA